MRCDGRKSRSFGPALLLLALFLIFTARWIWIAGLGDYGWIYELGARLLKGQIPYRDFACTLPQLTSYTIVPLLVLFKGSLWAEQFHVYLWWLATLLVGLRLLAKLGVAPELQTASLFMACCLSFPVATGGLAYNYAASTFAGLALLSFLDFSRSMRDKAAFLLGFWSGLTVLAKQNVGFAVALAAGLTLFGACLHRSNQKDGKRALFGRVAWFGVGAVVPVLFALCYWGAFAGFKEVFLAMFLDGGRAKGGLNSLLRSMLPLLPLHDHPFRSIAVSCATWLLFLAWFRKNFRYHSTADIPSPTLEERARERRPQFLCHITTATLLATVTIALLSLFNLPALSTWFERLTPNALARHELAFPFIFYCGIASLCSLAIGLGFAVFGKSSAAQPATRTGSETPTTADLRTPNSHAGISVVAAGIFAVLTILLISLADLPELKSLLTVLTPPAAIRPIRPDLVFPFVLYSGVTAFCVYAIMFRPRLSGKKYPHVTTVPRPAGCSPSPGGEGRGEGEPPVRRLAYFCRRALSEGTHDTALFVWLLALVCGQATSTYWYLLAGAPVTIPLAMHLLTQYKALRQPRIFASACGVFAILLFVAMPTPSDPPAFETLPSLPRDTAFAGLRAQPRYADWVKLLAQDISPKIHQRRTLWLCRAGPQLAYGGEPATGVPLLYVDTYTPRIENRVIDSWTAEPPEFAVLGQFKPCPGAKYLNQEYLREWVMSRYDCIWESTNQPASLWKRKTGLQ